MFKAPARGLALAAILLWTLGGQDAWAAPHGMGGYAGTQQMRFGGAAYPRLAYQQPRHRSDDDARASPPSYPRQGPPSYPRQPPPANHPAGNDRQSYDAVPRVGPPPGARQNPYAGPRYDGDPRNDGLPASVQRIQRRTGGQVLRAQPYERDGREVYRVKVLTPEGRIRVYEDDGGAWRGPPPASGPPQRARDREPAFEPNRMPPPSSRGRRGGG